MITYKFSEIIDVAKFSNCKTCNKFVYTIPCQLDADFEQFMLPLGGVIYPLDKFKIITVDNSVIQVASRIGRTWIDVKFKDGVDKIKPIFDLQLASYVSHRNSILIEM